jgi:hypothetical protein
MVSGCKKDKATPNSGTITINNELTGSGPYYATGFSVPTGRVVSFINSPLDVITIQEDHDINMNVRQLLFVCENSNNSFFKYGEYTDGASAKTAFDNLKAFTADLWTATGDTVRANQIWLFRTFYVKYAKFRVISTATGPGTVYPHVECTFEWVFQPDGTKIFP